MIHKNHTITKFNVISFQLFFGLLLNGFSGYSQSQYSICNQSMMIVKTAEKYHFMPKDLDNGFSDLVYSKFISLLDPYGLYFSKADIKKFEDSKNNIDEEIQAQQCDFFNLVCQTYIKNLSSTDSILKSFKNTNFDYTTFDTIFISNKIKYYSKRDLIARWKKVLKYRALYTFFNNLDTSNYNGEPNEEKLKDVQNSAIDREICRLKSKLNYGDGLEAYVGVKYLKSIALAYDPYTNYFTQSEQQEFLQLLSKETLSFGFEISKNEFGEVEIYQIIPGGAAWNSNQLNEGDIILGVISSDFEKDFNCIDLKEAVRFLSSEKISTAAFLVKKKSGKQIEVSLNKATIEVQDNVIKSYILSGSQDIGYIYLPSFYTKGEDNSLSNGCANDIAKEVMKLKNEGIKGLIIDLRYNGGGSMLEAVLMAGIFIDYGAVSIIHSRDEKPQTLKDMNRGTIYDSPIVILINEFSASSSELFAASMQDLNRAIIVGSNSYGKSTMQEILPIDAYKHESRSSYYGEPPAFIKISRGAFYRVNGESHNLTGVVPDIVLPSLYDSINLKNDNGLRLDKLNKKTYYYPLKKLPISDLKLNSNKRLKSDSSFAAIGKLAEEVAYNQLDGYVPLNYDLFKQLFIESKSEKSDNYEINSPFTVKKPSYMDVFSTDSEANNKIVESNILEIEEDIYIFESFNIMIDLINTQTK